MRHANEAARYSQDFQGGEVTRLGIDSGLQSTLASFSLAFIELTKYYSRLFVHAHCKKSENFLAGCGQNVSVFLHTRVVESQRSQCRHVSCRAQCDHTYINPTSLYSIQSKEE